MQSGIFSAESGWTETKKPKPEQTGKQINRKPDKPKPEQTGKQINRKPDKPETRTDRKPDKPGKQNRLGNQ